MQHFFPTLDVLYVSVTTSSNLHRITAKNPYPHVEPDKMIGLAVYIEGKLEYIERAYTNGQENQITLKLAEARPQTFVYTNWRGETKNRVLIPIKMWYGHTEWHPEDQTLLQCIDVEQHTIKDYALSGFKGASSYEW